MLFFFLESFFYKEHKTKLNSIGVDFHPSDSILRPLEVSVLTNLSGLLSPSQTKTKGPSLKQPIFTQKKAKSPNESEFYKDMSQKLLIKVKHSGSRDFSKEKPRNNLEEENLIKIQAPQPCQEQNDYTLEKSPSGIELPSLNTQRYLSNSPKRSRPKMIKKSCADFKQLKSEILKGMDKSQEKIKLEGNSSMVLLCLLLNFKYFE